MKYRLVVRPEVDEDLLAAESWYDNQRPWLGAKFLQAVRTAIASLAENPHRFRLRHRGLQVRWAYPAVFPYRIVFRILDDTIVIYTVIHSARRLRAWRNRVQP